MQQVEFYDSHWYVTSRRHATGKQARTDYELLMRESKKRHGQLELGVFRHNPSNEPEGTYLTVLGMSEENVAYAEGLLRGAPVELDAVDVHALIARRVRVISELLKQDAQAGTYEYPHGPGETLTRGGEFRRER